MMGVRFSPPEPERLNQINSHIMINLDTNQIIDAIENSQHCQRNWDLNKTIPEEHINLFIEAVKRAPSKQNIAFYKTHFITNRDLIQSISQSTRPNPLTSWIGNNFTTYDYINPQALANLLIVFEYYKDYSSPEIHNRNAEVKAAYLDQSIKTVNSILNIDRYSAIGIASGYVALLANMLGYSTGFCACLQSDEISKLLNTDNKILLLLGVGFANEGVPHNVRHDGKKHITLSKQEILVNRIS